MEKKLVCCDPIVALRFNVIREYGIYIPKSLREKGFKAKILKNGCITLIKSKPNNTHK